LYTKNRKKEGRKNSKKEGRKKPVMKERRGERKM
jgi:hypothetical protein